MPLFGALIERIPHAGESIALSRADCIKKRDWDRAHFVEAFLRPACFDETLASIKPIGPRGHVAGFNFLRERGERPFSEEDRALLQLFTDAAVELLHKPPPWVSWKLTAREEEVVKGIEHGHSNKELAIFFGCAVRTVETHVANVFRKADVTSRAKLVALLRNSKRS